MRVPTPTLAPSLLEGPATRTTRTANRADNRRHGNHLKINLLAAGWSKRAR